MPVLSADDVRAALPMEEAIVVMKKAFVAASTGNAVTPLRSNVSFNRRRVPPHAGRRLFPRSAPFTPAS